MEIFLRNKKIMCGKKLRIILYLKSFRTAKLSSFHNENIFIKYLLCAGHCANFYTGSISHLILITALWLFFILQMKSLRLREVEWLVPGPTAAKWIEPVWAPKCILLIKNPVGLFSFQMQLFLDHTEISKTVASFSSLLAITFPSVTIFQPCHTYPTGVLYGTSFPLYTWFPMPG